jgi:hypothetical protein
LDLPCVSPALLKPNKPTNYNLATFFVAHGASIGLTIHWLAESELVNRRTPNRYRILAALACLLALASLYVPFAAAWSSHARACCTAGYCNIPNHHHQKATPHSTVGEDCDHAMAGMMDCSMSCCQDPDKPAVTSMAFVLPRATFAASAMMVTGSVERAHFTEIPRTIAPVSPPPRTDHAAR